MSQDVVREPESAVSVKASGAAAPVAAEAPHAAATDRWRLRLWPAIVIVLIQVAMMKLPMAVGIESPMTIFMGMMFGPILGVLGLAGWWLFASRVTWGDRLLVLGAWAIGAAGAWFFCHPTMNVRGMGLMMVALPAVSVMWVIWLFVSMEMPWNVRRWGLVVTLLGTWTYYSLVRIDGMSGSFATALSWRFMPTAEEKFLAEQPASGAVSQAPAATDAAPLVVSSADWPGFRGPDGTGRYTGEPIRVDWEASPPQAVWKHAIGPGWSSMAVVGDLLFTQEQRGEDEAIVCYATRSGEQLWAFQEKSRFFEVVAGTGPRATPTYHGGRIYAVSALGMVHCLDARSGAKIWSSPMVTAPNVSTPEWGYASSPVIVGSTVVVLPGKPEGQAVVAFDNGTGQRLWAAGDGDHSYTSIQRATFGGIEQLLALTSAGLIALNPSDGAILWTDPWPANGVARCVQPYVDGDTVLISTYFGIGSRKLRVKHSAGSWSTELVWESKDMKPYFNDLVVLDGYAYGFDGNIFCCLDLETGQRQWKGGRYGNGQVLLLEQQRKLLVLSEQGEVILLDAVPEERREVARFAAIDGKTWNHPVVAHGKLFVRNGEQIACFDVAPASRLAARGAQRNRDGR
ncbi:MAG: PQQ-binding-like beta-propeller repeat protein [Pirellulaceae bacterium]